MALRTAFTQLRWGEFSRVSKSTVYEGYRRPVPLVERCLTNLDTEASSFKRSEGDRHVFQAATAFQRRTDRSTHLATGRQSCERDRVHLLGAPTNIGISGTKLSVFRVSPRTGERIVKLPTTLRCGSTAKTTRVDDTLGTPGEIPGGGD